MSFFLYWTGNLLLGITPEPPLLYRFVLSHHHLEFLLGVIAGYLVIRPTGSNARHWLLGSGVVLFTLVSAYTVWDVNRVAAEQGIALVVRAELLKTVTEHHSYLFFGVPSFLIVLGSAFIDRLDRWRVPNGLLFIGDASYAIYLTHATLINIITLLLAKVWYYDLGITVPITLSISVVIGCLVHTYVESPLLAFLNRHVGKLKTKTLVLEVA